MGMMKNEMKREKKKRKKKKKEWRQLAILVCFRWLKEHGVFAVSFHKDSFFVCFYISYCFSCYCFSSKNKNGEKVDTNYQFGIEKMCQDNGADINCSALCHAR